jgi:hypothetical protein
VYDYSGTKVDLAARRDANNKKKRAGRLVLAKKVGPAVDVDDEDDGDDIDDGGHEENVDSVDPGVVAQGADGHADAGHAGAAVIPEEPMAAALAVPEESPAAPAVPDGPDRPPVVEEDNELEEFTQGGAIQGT